jgi:hypothetical protein
MNSGNSSEIKSFIRHNAELFWFVPEAGKEDISEECLVETILNYGSMDEVIRLMQLLGVGRTAQVFFTSIERSERRRNNYHELTINYFVHLFRKYAPQHSH